MEWYFKKFDKLRLAELYDLLKLRASVFVVEQNCPYKDLDEKDHHAIHLLGYEKQLAGLFSNFSAWNNR